MFDTTPKSPSIPTNYCSSWSVVVWKVIIHSSMKVPLVPFLGSVVGCHTQKHNKFTFLVSCYLVGRYVDPSQKLFQLEEFFSESRLVWVLQFMVESCLTETRLFGCWYKLLCPTSKKYFFKRKYLLLVLKMLL